MIFIVEKFLSRLTEDAVTQIQATENNNKIAWYHNSNSVACSYTSSNPATRNAA